MHHADDVCLSPGRPSAVDVTHLRFREYCRTRDRALRNVLVEEHRWLARVAARRFANRGEPVDDLQQVALLGVLKAVERFDPEYGSSFATFALRVSEDQVIEAIEAGNAYRTTPLHGWPTEDGGFEEGGSLVAHDDARLNGAAERVALHELLARLPHRERRILHLRFFADLTQSEIAEQVGVSQVHVSRLLRSCLAELRSGLRERTSHSHGHNGQIAVGE